MKKKNRVQNKKQKYKKEKLNEIPMERCENRFCKRWTPHYPKQCDEVSMNVLSCQAYLGLLTEKDYINRLATVLKHINPCTDIETIKKKDLK